jgi:hypothetical protein
MSKKPLQTNQEKVLYLMKLLGPDETLDILETEVKDRCCPVSSNQNTVLHLRRVK